MNTLTAMTDGKPPIPEPPPHEQDRIAEQSLRYRMLKGKHRADVEDEIEADIAPELAPQLTWNADLSANPLKSIYTQLNTAYIEPPEVRIKDAEIDDADLEHILTPELWPLMVERSLFQMGIREVLVRLDWPSQEALDDGDPAEVSYRVVPPHCIHDHQAHPRHPDRLIYLEERRERTRQYTDDEGRRRSKKIWTFDVYDLRDPEQPVFRIEEVVENDRKIQERRDVTAEFHDGEGYPYRDRQERPIFPYVLYHGRMQSQLWDYEEGVELVRGSLRLASGWTWWWDGFHNAADPQRVGIDLDFPKGNTRILEGGVNVEEVVTAHKAVLRAQSKGEPGTGRIDHWPPGMDPQQGVESLRAYEERLSIYEGLSGGDLRVSGTPASGVSISISREGKRQRQQAYEPAFRRGDQWVLATAARMANAYVEGLELPEDPRAYNLRYARLGESLQERKTLTEVVEKESALGVMSRVARARALRPELETDEDAIAYLVEQARLEVELDQAIAEQQRERSEEADGVEAVAQIVQIVMQQLQQNSTNQRRDPDVR